MAKEFRPVRRDQVFLMPPDMREWLPSDHLVWFILDTLEALDLTGLEATRRRGGVGAAGYDPCMLLGLLMYGYCRGVRSSRQIERLCGTDVAFRVLCAQDVPDHCTLARFEEFEEKWGKPYPAISRLWRNAWSEFVPFLDHDVEIRRVICSTNAIESLNARYRRAVRARGHFPNDQAALKCLYLVTRSLDPTGKGKARWAMRWKPALNAFAITFEGRIHPAGN